MKLKMLMAYVVLCSATASAQSGIINAQLTTSSAAAGLERELRGLNASQSGPSWAGYAVPLIDGEHHMCCNSSGACCGRCSLEGNKADTGISVNPGAVKLEGPAEMFVLFRMQGGAVQKIRMFTPDCELDAGGLPFHWFTGVRPSESVDFLASYAMKEPESTERRLADSAVAAIALHKDGEADRILESFVATGQPESLRERTAFWLGNARGRRGYETLLRMLQSDPSDRVRDKVVFALSQSREPEALDSLIQAARSDRSSHVRGQALFWLAQKAGKKAASAITGAIENDPETDVKKRAVFALSQLPKDEGVPLLIQVARTNRNLEVRKQAVFWLGQSKDARALAFFEEILKQ